MFAPVKKSLRGVMGSMYNSIQGQKIWLRPTGFNTQKMLWLLDKIRNDDNLDYIMFMLHSSEFMPGGSPTFRTEESIDLLYDQIETVFKAASQHFEGFTISEYGDSYMSKK